VINPPSLLEGVATALLAVALCGAAWFLLRGRIFLNVLVGGGGGAAGPKELMGWVGAVAHGMDYPPPTPRFTKVAPIVFYDISKIALAKSETIRAARDLLRAKCEEQAFSCL
jgi:hypothetical protein